MSQKSNPGSPATPELTSKFKDILTSNGITDPIFEVIVKNAGLQGEHFGSLTEYVTVAFEDPGKPPLSLFVKRRFGSIEQGTRGTAHLLDSWQSFQKEAQFFMEYLPKAEEFCKSVGKEKLMNIYPRCYYGDETMIVLENLILGRGFTLLRKEDQQHFETSKLALANLAKHHAISHSLIQENGGPDAFFERYPKLKHDGMKTEAGRAMLGSMFRNGIKANISILEKCRPEGHDQALEKLKSWAARPVEDVMNNLKTTSGDFLVLAHGDYWNNNMMFLKDKESDAKMVAQIMLDFQLTRYASPSVDLGYFLFTSVKQTVRREKLNELLNVYLEALKTFSNELGHPVDISLPELEASFCKHFHYGYWIGMVLVTGAGFQVMKEYAGGNDSFMQNWEQLVVKWVDEHPEEAQVKAKFIIDNIRDFEGLDIGVIP